MAVSNGALFFSFFFLTFSCQRKESTVQPGISDAKFEARRPSHTRWEKLPAIYVHCSFTSHAPNLILLVGYLLLARISFVANSFILRIFDLCTGSYSRVHHNTSYHHSFLSIISICINVKSLQKVPCGTSIKCALTRGVRYTERWFKQLWSAGKFLYPTL
jgi:hypothetical protein